MQVNKLPFCLIIKYVVTFSNRTKVLTTVPATAAAQQVRPMTISFQADSNGNIFSVTNGNDKVVRIYDTRIRGNYCIFDPFSIKLFSF